MMKKKIWIFYRHFTIILVALLYFLISAVALNSLPCLIIHLKAFKILLRIHKRLIWIVKSRMCRHTHISQLWSVHSTLASLLVQVVKLPRVSKNFKGIPCRIATVARQYVITHVTILIDHSEDGVFPDWKLSAVIESTSLNCLHSRSQAMDSSRG